MTTSQPVVKTYIEYLRSGLPGFEMATAEVPGRDTAAIARTAPPDVVAFRLYDVLTAEVIHAGLRYELRSVPLNRTPLAYIDATLLSIGEVAALPGDHRALLDQMRGAHTDVAVRCRTGAYRLGAAGDYVISSQRAGSRS